MPPITLDINPSLQNIQQRIQGNNPLTAFIDGRNAGFQGAQQQNVLSQYARQNQARQFAPGVVQGDQNAFKNMVALDPEGAMSLAQSSGTDPKTMFDRLGSAIYATQSPDDMARVQKWAIQNGLPHADELTWENKPNLVAEHQTVSGQIANNFETQKIGIDQRKADIEAATLQRGIFDQDRNYYLNVGKANMTASRLGLPPVDGPPPNVGGFQPPAAAAPGAPSPVASGNAPNVSPVGAPPTQMTTIPSPNATPQGGSGRPPGQTPPAGQQPPMINGFKAVVAGQPLVSKYGGTPLYPNAIAANAINGTLAGDLPPDTKQYGTYALQVKAGLAAAGYDFTKANEDYQGVLKNIGVMNGPKMVQQRAAIDQLSESIPLVRELAQQWQQLGLSGQIPAWNRITLSAAMNGVAGEKAQILATKLASQINHMSPELAMIYKGGSSATDAAMEKADTQLRADWSLPQLMSALDLVEQNMVYRKNSLKQAAVGAGGQPIGAPGNGQPQQATPGNAKSPVVINGYTIQEN